MVPIIYKLVDLDGIDLAEINGSIVSGIYQKITTAMSEDKIEIFYNWFYAGLMIPPSYVSIDDTVYGRYVINEAILVTSDDRVSQVGNVPVIQTLNVVENGTYQVPSGVTGFGPVVVEVPPPILVELNANENRTYEPGTDEDGFSKVIVNVPGPVLQSLSVTENGIFTPATGVDGFSQVNVDVGGAGVLKGKTTPSAAIGDNGDFYLQLGDDYISVDGDCVCNTGINAANAYGMTLRFTPTRLANSYQAYVSGILDNFTIGASSYIASAYDRCYGRIRGSERFVTGGFTGVCALSLINSVITLNDTQIGTYTGDSSLGNSSDIYVFSAPNGDRKSALNLYELIFYDANWNEILHLIPHLENNVPCLFDTISSTVISITGNPVFHQGTVINVYYKYNDSWIEVIGSNPNIY